LVCRKRKKISQIIIAYLYLAFFLLIILCSLDINKGYLMKNLRWVQCAIIASAKTLSSLKLSQQLSEFSAVLPCRRKMSYTVKKDISTSDSQYLTKTAKIHRTIFNRPIGNVCLKKEQTDKIKFQLKGTLSRDFLLQVFLMNHLPQSKILNGVPNTTYSASRPNVNK
jgi:hypothetical protein